MNKIRNESNSSDSTKSTTISNQTSTESIIIKIVFSVFTLCAGLIIAVSVWKIKTQDLTSARLFKNITCDKNSGNSSAVFEPVVSQCCDEKFCYCAKQTRTSRCFDERLRETVVIEPFLMSITRRENSQLDRNCEQELKQNEMTGNIGFHNVNLGICVRQHTELLAKSAKIINTKTKEIVDKMVIQSDANSDTLYPKMITDFQIELASMVSVKCDKNGLFHSIQPGDSADGEPFCARPKNGEVNKWLVYSKRENRCIKRKGLGPCTLKYHTTAKPPANSGQFDMECDEKGDFLPIQCDNDVNADYAWCICVDSQGSEIKEFGGYADQINSTSFCPV